MPIQDHPAKIKFDTFGSPLNLLSRHLQSYNGTLLFDNKKWVPRHYSDSQEVFAYLSMAALIDLSSAIPTLLIDTDHSQVRAEEVTAVEEFHKSITLYRFEIAESTQKRFAPFYEKNSDSLKFELCLMATLPENDPEKAEKGKIYLSDQGDYIVRNSNGKVYQDSLQGERWVDLTNLSNKIGEPALKKIVLDITSYREHTSRPLSTLRNSAIYGRYLETKNGFKFKKFDKPYRNITQEYRDFVRTAYYLCTSTQPRTYTTLSAIMYNLYNSWCYDEKLCLSEITKILDCKEPGDFKILLGSYDASEHTHRMGCYREVHNFGIKKIDGVYCSEITRVDEVTALALKKAYLTVDKEEALKYAFTYAVLRGYNLRSMIGACWAQELSLRCLFASKGWTQFQKAPGIYLDLAAVIHEYDSLEDLINAEIHSYQDSLVKTGEKRKRQPSCNDFFMEPDTIPGDFAYYLLINRQYRKEDVAELIFYQKYENNGVQSSFYIAAARKDFNFFILTEALLDEDRALRTKAKKTVFSQLNWEDIKRAAKPYEDAAFDLLLENFIRVFSLQEEDANEKNSFFPVSPNHSPYIS